jgi:hypothetical protein
MATAVLVEAAVAGRRRAGMAEHPLLVDLPVGEVPLRALVEAVVRAEVGAWAERARMRSLLAVLTERSLDEGLALGAVRHGESEAPSDVDPDAAVAAALEAFGDGIFRVLVDDEPVDDLDGNVSVHANSRLLFLRLVALAGG